VVVCRAGGLQALVMSSSRAVELCPLVVRWWRWWRHVETVTLSQCCWLHTHIS